MKPSEIRRQFFVFLILAAIIVLILTVLQFAEPVLTTYVKTLFPPQQIVGTEKEMGDTAAMIFNTIINVINIILWMGLIITVVRLINTLISGTLLRNTGNAELTILIRNVLSITIYVFAFVTNG